MEESAETPSDTRIPEPELGFDYGDPNLKATAPSSFVRASGQPQLVELFAWSEEQFLKRTEGSAIRRIGYECWLRNIAVALGNAPPTPVVTRALELRKNDPSELVREHVAWSLERHAEVVK